jgi:tRNA threonylcarbamoyladenosine biosynthesis protein TsaB
MRVLAIDTALAACAAAVLDTDQGRIIASKSRVMNTGHAEALLPLLAELTEEARTGLGDFDRIAVTTGPGSFTGLRVGISAARGIALAARKPAVGVSTLSAYAAPHIAADETVSVIAAIDARHDHVYLQVFGPGGRTVLPPRLAPMDEAVRAASEVRCRIVGSAAQAIASRLPQSNGAALLIDDRAAPDIGWVARIGAVLPEGQSPPKPQYLRAPDAQPQNAAQVPRR